MSQKVTLELPEETVQRARALARQMQRPVEDVLIEWIDRAASEPIPIDLLPDDQLLALCDSQLDGAEQTELSNLLERNREGTITADERQRLDEIMEHYRQGWLRKARAWKAAVGRGLKAPLN